MTIIPTANPNPIPTNKSVKTIPKIVTINGVNCFHPNWNMVLNRAGLARLYPTISNIAASTERGILFSKVGINNTEINKKKPCTMAESFDFPPD